MSVLDYIRVRNLTPKQVHYMYGRDAVQELRSAESHLEWGLYQSIFGENHWQWEPVGDIIYCLVEGCNEVTDFYPNLWDERLQLEYAIQGVCHAHCPGHEFEYDSDIQSYACIECGEPAPDDFYYD